MEGLIRVPVADNLDPVFNSSKPQICRLNYISNFFVKRFGSHFSFILTFKALYCRLIILWHVLYAVLYTLKALYCRLIILGHVLYAVLLRGI